MVNFTLNPFNFLLSCSRLMVIFQYEKASKVIYSRLFTLELKRIVNLLSGYPDLIVHGYPTDSDIISFLFISKLDVL